MSALLPDPGARGLLEPVADVLSDALERLPPAPDLEVGLGPVEGFAHREGRRLVLSEALAGPELHHPDEPAGPLPALDRWRRALACVLEARVLLALEEAGVACSDWRAIGLAVHLADRAVPEARLALADVAGALQAGDLGRSPRHGVAAWRAVVDRGDEPWAAAQGWIEGGGPSAEEFLGLGSRALAGAGELPLPVDRVAPVDIPVDLDPWRWQPLEVPAHPRGGRVVTEGQVAVGQAWAPGGTVLRTLAASGAAGGGLRPGIGGPAGTWRVASAHAFGQTFGARGIEFELAPSGRLQILFADAFVGPVAALEVAERVGTSGLVTGRWRVAGDHRIRFAELSTQGLTVHGRATENFAMPSPGQGEGDWIAALQDGPWAWEQEADRLVLRGPMMGGRVEMRWRPADD